MNKRASSILLLVLLGLGVSAPVSASTFFRLHQLHRKQLQKIREINASTESSYSGFDEVAVDRFVPDPDPTCDPGVVVQCVSEESVNPVDQDGYLTGRGSLLVTVNVDAHCKTRVSADIMDPADPRHSNVIERITECGESVDPFDIGRRSFLNGSATYTNPRKINNLLPGCGNVNWSADYRVELEVRDAQSGEAAEISFISSDFERNPFQMEPFSKSGPQEDWHRSEAVLRNSSINGLGEITLRCNQTPAEIASRLPQTAQEGKTDTEVYMEIEEAHRLWRLGYIMSLGH